MALAASPHDIAEANVPEDRFGIRIAVVRAARGWNITQAGEACGIKPENWRLWEKTGRHPQNYEEVCRKIASGSGFSRTWISAGGPLAAASPCFWPLPSIEGQMELSLGLEQPALEVASHAA